MSKKSEALVEIRDVVLWPQHIHGAPDLRERLCSLAAEEVVQLRIDGKLTTWSRMRDGKDGRPALGLKPCNDRTREIWSKLYRERRGDAAKIGLP